MEPLDPSQQEYVEDIGLFFEQNGSQRTMGKVIGLLLITEEPLSQEDLMRLLNLSRTSVSVAMRWAEHLGFIAQTSVAGDRKRYYQLQEDMADWMARSSFEELEGFLGLLTRAEELADPGACARLKTMQDLFHFLNERIQAAIAEWKEQRAVAARPARRIQH
jgi:biotin operon repressor